MVFYYQRVYFSDRCPGGVSKWSIHFVQAPTSNSISPNPFSDPEIDHIVTLVATILLPVEERESFLAEVRINNNLKFLLF